MKLVLLTLIVTTVVYVNCRRRDQAEPKTDIGNALEPQHLLPGLANEETLDTEPDSGFRSNHGNELDSQMNMISRRGRGLCRRKLNGICRKRRKPCPRRFPRQTSIGKYRFCRSKHHRCCFPECTLNCQNGGVCDLFGKNCICPSGWTGTNCSECTLNCANGGTCNSAGTACVCPSGWTGTTCTEPCNLNCENGGVCEKTSSGTRCVCQGNWTGPFCEECPLFCNNFDMDAECDSLAEKCICSATWTGATCEDFVGTAGVYKVFGYTSWSDAEQRCIGAGMTMINKDNPDIPALYNGYQDMIWLAGEGAPPGKCWHTAEFSGAVLSDQDCTYEWCFAICKYQ